MSAQTLHLRILMFLVSSFLALPAQALLLDDVEIEVTGEALGMPLNDIFIVSDGVDWSVFMGEVILEVDMAPGHFAIAFTNTADAAITLAAITIALSDLELRFQRGPRLGEVIHFAGLHLAEVHPSALDPVLVLDLTSIGESGAITLDFDSFTLGPNETSSVDGHMGFVFLLIPEPATVTLLALGVGGLALRMRRRG